MKYGMVYLIGVVPFLKTWQTNIGQAAIGYLIRSPWWRNMDQAPNVGTLNIWWMCWCRVRHLDTWLSQIAILFMSFFFTCDFITKIPWSIKIIKKYRIDREDRIKRKIKDIVSDFRYSIFDHFPLYRHHRFSFTKRLANRLTNSKTETLAHRLKPIQTSYRIL